MKIGRHEYEIIKGDKFLDNGHCFQLLTQSKEKSEWGHTPLPVLSKRAVAELKKMDNIKKYLYNNIQNCIVHEVV